MVSPALDPNSTTVEVWVEARNPKGRLRPGTSVQLSMLSRAVPNALVIPGAAVLTAPDGGTYVMVAGSDGRAHQTMVKSGIRQGDDVQILDGLREGDRVIASGAYGLPDKTKFRAEASAGVRPARPATRRPRDREKCQVGRMAMSNGEPSYWFSRHSRSIIVLIITLAMVGVYLAFTIPVAVFPATNFPRILIAVDNGVMPIDQMTVTVTRPIEEAVNSVPGLQQVRSITSRGSAEVDLFFDWNVDMFQTLQYVNGALSRVQPDLPPSAKVEAHRMTFASFPIMGYSLTSDTVPQTQLWEMATYELKPRLNRLDGVARVIVQGGQEPEFHIVPDPAKLLQTGVTVPDLLEAMRRTNLIDSPGLLERNHQLYLGLVNGQVRDPQQIAGTVIKMTPAGVPVRVGDVATVESAVRPLYTIVTANGKPAVLLNINRQPESNTVEVADEVHAEVERIRKSLPPGVEIRPFYDQSDIVSQSIRSVRDAILIGLILASIILVIFLHDWGTALVAGLVIPVTIAVTFIALKLMGQSFNLMTLGGLAAAVGLVIDNAIVVVENIALHRDTGQTRLQAIHSALREITVPLVGSTITPIVVFLPLVSITGVTGTFFRALAVTMSVSLLTSLALALTWTPSLSQFFIKRSSGSGRIAAGCFFGTGGGVHPSPDGGGRSLARRLLPEGDSLPRALAAARAGTAVVAGGLEPRAHRHRLRLLPVFRLRSAAGDG